MVEEVNKCKKCNDRISQGEVYCGKEIIKECSICLNKFKTRCNSREKRLCSLKCTSKNANLVKRERLDKKEKVYKNCDMCGKKFEYKTVLKDGVIGCSQKCRFQLRNGKRECNCCGKEYFPSTKNSKVCSYKCSGKMAQTKEAKEKRIATNIELFGVENPFSSKEIQEKIEDTTMKRYNVKNAMQNEDVKNKAGDTNFKRYGVRHPLQNEEIKNKMIKTNLKKFNVEFSIMCPEVKAKAIETTLKNHNVRTPFESPEIREKCANTLFERTGFYNPFEDKNVQDKASNTIEERYGTLNYSSSNEAKEKHKKRINETIRLYKEGFSEYEIAEQLSCEYITIRRTLLEHNLVSANNISQVNKYWQHLLSKKLGVEFKHEGSIFENKRNKVDLYHEESKIAIDINPTITHSTQETPIPYMKKTTVKYHQDRAIEAEENGWTLIQIFDWDSEEEIIELLKSKFLKNKRIYARKCVVKEISFKDSTAFLNANHRQKGRANSSIQYGLFFEDELVQVMTFSKERFARKQKENSYEMLRLASKKGVTVVGGASKLFKAFKNSDYKPKEIKTFADFSKGNGSLYLKLGMKYEGFANMNAFYSSIKSKEAYKVTEVTNKFKKEYSKLGMTQKEYMNSKGFYRINDAGHKVFKWTLE